MYWGFHKGGLVSVGEMLCWGSWTPWTVLGADLGRLLEGAGLNVSEQVHQHCAQMLSH